MSEPPLNGTLKSTFKVLGTDLASTVGPPEATDSFPPVFATSRLILFMEIVCAKLLKPHVQEGKLSVGVRVDVVHSAATLPGSTVTVEAKYMGKEGKLFLFQVVAWDEGGEVGRGKHTRGIIDEKRLVEGARKRSKI